MKATIRIVTPAAATAAAALLLTACADKPVRIPGGAFVEEPYQGETVTRTQTQTIQSNGTDTMEAEIIYIETDVPVGPVENDVRQDDLAGLQGGDQQLQPIEQQPETKSNVPEGSVEYKVVKGDTLWGIGMVYGVTVDRLAEINGISKNSTLRVGQVLMIPPDAKNAVGKPIPQKKADAAKSNATSTKTDTSAKSSATKTETSTKASTATATKTPATKDGETLYVVKSGDNLSTIAYRHHVKLADLIAANKVDPKAILRVGQTLVIPAAGTNAASTSTATTKSTTSTSTGTKTTDSAAATTTKSGSATTTTTTTTKASETSQQKSGEGTGGIVEPLSGSSFSGSGSATTTTTTTRPAATTQPASSGSSSLGLAPVSAVPDAGVLPIITDFDSTIEELADYHGRSLVEMMRLNPQFKSGQRIPRGTSINLPFE